MSDAVNASGGGFVDAEGRTQFGMDAEVALKRHLSYDPRREFAVRAWVEACLDERLQGETLIDALGSGQPLLRLLSAMGVEVKPSEISQRRTALHDVENRKTFLDKCVRAGLLRNEDLFNPHTRDSAALTTTLEALARVVAADPRFSHLRQSLPPVALQTAGSRRLGGDAPAPARRWSAMPPPVRANSTPIAADHDPAALRNEIARLERELAFQRARCDYLEEQLSSDGVGFSLLRIRICPTWSRTKKRVVSFGLLLTTILCGSLYFFATTDRAPLLGQRMAGLLTPSAQSSV